MLGGVAGGGEQEFHRQGDGTVASWGLRPSAAQWVHETYRRRFGIESSYRQLHQARIRTCTRSPLLRLLYVAIALILRNVWVWLHREVLAQGRRGGGPIYSAPGMMSSAGNANPEIRRQCSPTG